MMRRLLPLLLAAFLLLTGCGSDASQGESVTVYYLRDLAGSPSQSAVEPVSYPILRNSDKVTAAIKQLLSKPGADGLSSPFLTGTTLTSVKYEGEKIIIGLSEEYGSLTGADLAAADACAVLTLCGIEGISSVQINVDGTPHPGHQADYFITKEDIVTDDMSLLPVELQAVLYFSDGNTGYLLPEYKNIIVRENESIERFMVEELIKGPSADGLQRILHENTKILSIETKNRICYINFSSDFLKGFGDNRALEIQTLNSVTNSMCTIDGIEGVQFLVEGKQAYGNVVMRENPAVIGAYTDEFIDMQLYLNDTESRKLVPVPARIEAGGGFALERLIVEQMIRGIDGGGFLSVIPQGTMLIDIQNDRNTCILNFSKEFIENDSGKIDRDLMIQAIVYSLTTATDSIDNVQILVEGKDVSKGKIYTPDASYLK